MTSSLQAAILTLLGIIFGFFGVILAILGAILGPSWGVLGPSWKRENGVFVQEICQHVEDDVLKL